MRFPPMNKIFRYAQQQLRHSIELKRCLSTSNQAPKAALCIIGNEVLSGKTADTNSFFIANMMFKKGIDLKKIVVIPDEMDVISSTVKELSDFVGSNGYVFTTGGIGPTHDDITYEGVAKAFGGKVTLHQPTYDALVQHMIKRNRGHEMNDDRKRMAILPEGCKILTTATWVPIAVVKNVYILPGIPSMVRDMLTFNKDHFVGVPIYRAIIRTKKLEGDIAKPLAFLQKQYPLVSLGSYLNLTEEKTGKRDDSYNTKLSIEGRDFYQVEEIAHTLLNITHGYRYFTNEVE